MVGIKKLLYKKILRSRTLAAEQKYKLYKIKLTIMLRCAEKSYYSSLLVANRGYAKSTWNVLNTVINKKMCQKELPKHFECNGEDQSLPTNLIHFLLLSDRILPMHSQL